MQQEKTTIARLVQEQTEERKARGGAGRCSREELSRRVEERSPTTFHDLLASALIAADRRIIWPFRDLFIGTLMMAFHHGTLLHRGERDI